MAKHLLKKLSDVTRLDQLSSRILPDTHDQQTIIPVYQPLDDYPRPVPQDLKEIVFMYEPLPIPEFDDIYECKVFR